MSLLKREQTAPAWQFALIAVIVVVLVAVVATLMPASIDWRTAFRPAAREMLATGNPYHVEGFFNPPWTVLPMIPLALLPERVGSAAMLVLGLAGFAIWRAPARREPAGARRVPALSSGAALAA